MIKCPVPAERKCSFAADGEELKHQGAENSPLKNSAPLSLTDFKTSESTSITDSVIEIGHLCQETGMPSQVLLVIVAVYPDEDREDRGSKDICTTWLRGEGSGNVCDLYTLTKNTGTAFGDPDLPKLGRSCTPSRLPASSIREH